jgi:hypothetical protein
MGSGSVTKARITIVATIIAFVGLASCGTSSSGGSTSTSSSNTATGNVAGHSFAAKDAIFTTASSTSGFSLGTGSVTVISIESGAGACAEQQSAQAVVTLDVDMALAQVDATGNTNPVSETGTYAVTSGTPGSGLFAQVVFEPLCKMANPSVAVVQATGGSVTVTEVDRSHVAGTLDLTFGTDHVTGSFYASSCSAFAVNKTLC